MSISRWGRLCSIHWWWVWVQFGWWRHEGPPEIFWLMSSILDRSICRLVTGTAWQGRYQEKMRGGFGGFGYQTPPKKLKLFWFGPFQTVNVKISRKKLISKTNSEKSSICFLKYWLGIEINHSGEHLCVFWIEHNALIFWATNSRFRIKVRMDRPNKL